MRRERQHAKTFSETATFAAPRCGAEQYSCVDLRCVKHVRCLKGVPSDCKGLPVVPLCRCCAQLLSTACYGSGVHDTVRCASNAADIVTETSCSWYTIRRPVTAADWCKRRHTIIHSRQQLFNRLRTRAKRNTSENFEHIQECLIALTCLRIVQRPTGACRHRSALCLVPRMLHWLEPVHLCAAHCIDLGDHVGHIDPLTRSRSIVARNSWPVI